MVMPERIDHSYDMCAVTFVNKLHRLGMAIFKRTTIIVVDQIILSSD